MLKYKREGANEQRLNRLGTTMEMTVQGKDLFL